MIWTNSSCNAITRIERLNSAQTLLCRVVHIQRGVSFRERQIWSAKSRELSLQFLGTFHVQPFQSLHCILGTAIVVVILRLLCGRPVFLAHSVLGQVVLLIHVNKTVITGKT